MDSSVELFAVSSKELEDVSTVNLKECLEFSDMIIPAVPISAFESKIVEIGDILREDFVNSNLAICDVCSVKVFPNKVMKDVLPISVSILNTHPMWGPDSTKNGQTLKDLKFIYHIERNHDSEIIQEFIEFWRKLGQEVISMTPDEHDKQAAYTHAYAFLIGKLGMLLNVRRNDISTKGFEGVLYNQEAVENDTSELFNDMFTYNPYAKEMTEQFISSAISIRKSLYEDV